MSYFVTGTDTDVGKTVASAWLVHHLKASYWKPIQSGVSQGRDIDAIKRLSGCVPESIIPGCYEFNAPLSPHLAAAIENQTINLDFIINTYTAIPPSCQVIVEGAGGLMVPLTQTDLMIDLIQQLKIPVILGVRTALGTINHTLLSLEALRQRSIPIAGVIAIGADNEHNLAAIEHYGRVKIIAHIPILSPLCFETLSTIQPRIPLC